MKLTLDPQYLYELASRPLSRHTIRLLGYLLERADAAGLVRVPRLEMAGHLDTHPEALTANLTRLVNAGLIRRVGKPAETLAVVFNHEVLA